MRIAKIDLNDCDNGKGICVSLWTQGCEKRCKGCHNPETWDRYGGKEIPFQDVVDIIIEGLSNNGVKRNFSILGGEPLTEYNRIEVYAIICEVRRYFPDIKIFLWTGYTLEELLEMDDQYITYILKNIDVLIDGEYKESERNITLELRGSTNQRIINCKELELN